MFTDVCVYLITVGSHIYMLELLLGVNRDMEMLGKANKLDPNFNKDIATMTYEAAQFINKNNKQPTIDVGKVKITPGACTCHLDSKHIKPVWRHYFSTNKGFNSNKRATFVPETHLQGEHTRGTRPHVTNLSLSATITIEAYLQREHTYRTQSQVANLALSAIKHKGTAPSEQVQKYPTDTFLSLLLLSPSRSHATTDTQPSVPCRYTSLLIYVTHQNTHSNAYRSARPVCLPLHFVLFIPFDFCTPVSSLPPPILF